ncbi:hypothetical protein INS49_011629 [Diaporthe citri]|uniref:uncharacterized protein n=1 Tax=Diaporthe citri TaxID=83186 RepID=UPI001C818CB0|nr:uncharacterized protein INS49_011629 [Diaporthe citri]KAG6360567.1 hypothetical protein INS49_011629 [Diaporthe citri]
MSSSSSALPTPRQLLTSILNQISKIPAPTAPGPGDAPAQKSSTVTRTDSFPERAREPPTNPLRLIEASHRPLFTTLHVLFPSLLLPALDLLDRGLVARLLSPGEAATSMSAEGGSLAHQDGGSHGTQQEDGGGSQVRDSTAAAAALPTSPLVYLVRSAQKPTRRPYGGGGDAPGTTAAPTTTSSSSSQRTYVVHTTAWNCTCAAFAFSAFPPLAGAPTLLGQGHNGPEDPVSAITIMDDGDDAEESEEGEERGPWQFGGVSFDGCTGEGGVPPCCKHLLACPRRALGLWSGETWEGRQAKINLHLHQRVSWVARKAYTRNGEFEVFGLLFCSWHMILAGRSVGFLS